MFTWTEASAAFWEDSAKYTKSYDRLADRAAAHLVPDGTVFEGGCGLGHLSLALSRRGYAVTAMDASPPASSVSARKRPAAEPVPGHPARGRLRPARGGCL